MPDVEIWKPVKGFEGLYEVSSLGRVKGVKRKKILTPRVAHGSLQVELCRDGKRTFKSLPKLVADAFLGAKPSEDARAVHIDGDIYNNAAANLRYRKAFYCPENTEARKLFYEFAEKNVLAFIYTKYKYINSSLADTNDFKQEALLKIWKDVDSYDGEISFVTFCNTKCNDVYCRMYAKYIRIKSREISAYETYGDDTNPRYLIDTLACTDNFYERIDANA